MFEADVVSATAAHPLATSVGKDKKGTIRQFLEDGREIVQYKSGEEVVVHDDGSMEQSNNFGERIEIDREGNRTEVVDGVVMVFNGTTNQLIRQENPDGSCIEFKDGEKTESFADGSTKVWCSGSGPQYLGGHGGETLAVRSRAAMSCEPSRARDLRSRA